MKELLGQLLIIGLEESRWTSACEKLIRRIQPGGVLLAEHNLRDPQHTAEILRKIAAVLDVPPFLAIEEEGGSVDPLRALFPSLPSPHLAAVKGLAVVERLGALIGEACALLGFNLSFAPRLDLANPDLTSSLQHQLFHSEPSRVARCGKEFLVGMRRHGMQACAKYFPGCGSVDNVSQVPVPIIDKPMRELWREDLLPFRAVLSKLACLKLSPFPYKAYDFDHMRPAWLSAKILQGLLREKLGYRGLAIADPFDVMPIYAGPGPRSIGIRLEVVTHAIAAGCDVSFDSRFVRMADYLANIVAKAADDEEITAKRLSESLRRIRRTKRGLRLPPAKFSSKGYDQLCRKFEDFRRDVQIMEREGA